MRTKNQKKSPKTAKPEVALRALAPGQARRLVKPHTGFEQWVEPLAQLFEMYADELGRGDVDVELMRSSLAAYKALLAPRAETAGQLALYDDTLLLHASVTWDQILTIYRRAQASAKKNGKVAGEIVDFERWMKTGPHKKPAPTTPTTP